MIKSLISDLNIHIYADGAFRDQMVKRYQEQSVQGFTTNPSLMAKAGVKDYKAYCLDLLKTIHDLPVSFEVFSDEFAEMEKQALEIKTWGKNVYVKIPITNTKKESAIPLIQKLLAQGLKLNITALFTETHLQDLLKILKSSDDTLISVFAGRIADTGVNPMPFVKKAVQSFAHLKGSKILWASTREIYNLYQAAECGCHIITMADDLIDKIKIRGKSLDESSLETIKGFYKDSQSAGFFLETEK